MFDVSSHWEPKCLPFQGEGSPEALGEAQGAVGCCEASAHPAALPEVPTPSQTRASRAQQAWAWTGHLGGDAGTFHKLPGLPSTVPSPREALVSLSTK